MKKFLVLAMGMMSLLLVSNVDAATKPAKLSFDTLLSDKNDLKIIVSGESEIVKMTLCLQEAQNNPTQIIMLKDLEIPLRNTLFASQIFSISKNDEGTVLITAHMNERIVNVSRHNLYLAFYFKDGKSQNYEMEIVKTRSSTIVFGHVLAVP